MGRKAKIIDSVDRVYRKALLDFERKWWSDCLARNGGSVSAAAREAGENRTVAYKMLKAKGVPRRIGRQAHRGNWGALTD